MKLRLQLASGLVAALMVAAPIAISQTTPESQNETIDRAESEKTSRESRIRDLVMKVKQTGIGEAFADSVFGNGIGATAAD
jgi:hypothetical protein